MGGAAAMATYFIAFMVATEVVRVARRRSRQYMTTITLLRGLRWRHLRSALLTIGVTAVSCTAFTLALSPFAWATTGWWQLLGGTGNVIFASSDASASDQAPFALKLIPVLIPFALLLIVPGLARLEERVFRRGMQRLPRWKQLRWQLVFGLVHMIPGVSLSIALGLAVTGLMYLRVYARALKRSGSQGVAVIEAARTHALANLTLVLIVILGMALKAFQG